MKPTQLIVFFALVAAAVAFLIPRFQLFRTKKLEFKTLDEQMQFLANSAVEMADRNFGIKLDYTADSIKKVEEILGKLHDEFQRTKPTKGVIGLAMAYGAYIGETIKCGDATAKWEQSDEVGGKNSYPLQWNGGASYVCASCYRRITNGDEDNVWLKYTAVKDRNTVAGD